MRLFGFAMLLVLLVPSAQASIYNVNITDTSGTISVIGTISTDDTIGALAASNITDWDLTVDSTAVLTGPLSGNNSTLFGEFYSALTATTSSLSFNFADTNRSFVEFDDGTASLILHGSNFADTSNGILVLGELSRAGLSPIGNELDQQTGLDVTELIFHASTIIPPVPEPSTWAMLLIGFAGIGFAAYRKSRSTALTG
jgi:hypothetical protein